MFRPIFQFHRLNFMILNPVINVANSISNVYTTVLPVVNRLKRIQLKKNYELERRQIYYIQAVN